jgi:PAS domain S-box-containing protein
MTSPLKSTPALVHILIVEDSPTQGESLRYLLEQNNYKVAWVKNGKLALAYLHETRPALVISDINMPEMTGFELCQYIKAEPHFQEIPVILLTSLSDTEDVLEGLSCGADSFITKPYSAAYLLELVNRTLAEQSTLTQSRVPIEVEIKLAGKSRLITTSPQQTVNLLLSTYEAALHRNLELVHTQAELNSLNEHLEDLVAQRTVTLSTEITERKLIQAQLQQSEEFFRLLADGMRDCALFMLDPEGRVVNWNSGAEKIKGYRAEEIIGKHFSEFYIEADVKSGKPGQALLFALEHGQFQEEGLRKRKEGTTFMAEVTITALYNDAGKLRSFVKLTRDITERKQAEDTVKASESKYRELIELASDGIALINPLGHIIETNTRYGEMSGYAPSEILQMTIGDVIASQDLEQTPVDFGVVQSGQTLLIERLWRRKDGTFLPVELSAKQLPSGNIQAIIRDISQRKQMEAALVQSEIAYRTLFENAPISLYRTAVNGKILEANPAMVKTFGYGDRAALQAMNIVDLYVDPASNERFKSEIYKNDIVTGFSAEFYCQDGTTFWAEDYIRVVRDALGVAIAYEGSLIDVTERKQADEKIRFQATLLDTVGQAVIATDLSGHIVYWNHFAETLYGWLAAEALGRNVIEVIVSDTSVDQATEILASLQTGLSWSGEYHVRRRDGTLFPVLAVDSPILAEDGTLIGIVGISTDISEIKQREYELEALADASKRLRTAESRAEMPSVILDMLMTLFKAEGASLITHEVAAGEWLVELGRGNLASVTSAHQPVTTGLSGQIIASGELYLSDNLNEDPRARPLITLPSTLATAGVPLVAQNQTIGVLWVCRLTPFTPSEVRILIAFADIAANAIQRATLHNQTERRLRHLRALHAIDLAIKSSLDLRLTLTLLLEHITTQLEVDAACILIVDHHTKFLEFTVGRGFRNHLSDRVQVRLGEGYAGQAALERRIVHIPNLNAQAGNTRLLKTLASESFVSYYAVPLVAKGQVQGVLEIFHRTTFKPDEEWLEFLESLADQTAIAIDSAQLFAELQRTNTDLLMAYSATIEGWSRALDLRDKETEGHSQRVTEITLDLAQAMNSFSEAEFTYIRWGSLLHDIGKMGIPDHILLKPGKLTDEEWLMMRQHPVFAFQLLLPIAYLKPALDIPYCHHEKWDGTGYPRALKGQSIPLAARLFAVVDVWDALRSDRPYRQGWSEEKVRQYILDQAGTHFDPQVVQVFFQMLSSSNYQARSGG